MATKKQMIERWENVLRVLRSLTRHEREQHWDMGQWGQKTDCGTIACAAGHCGADPWFRKRGLKRDYENYHGFYVGFWSEIHPQEFFDEDGFEGIFANATQRPVGTVIREVRAHIKELKSAADEGAKR